MSQLIILEASNEEIIEDAMTIDEADNSQEYLIINNILNGLTSTCVEHEGTIFHEYSLLKHSISET